MANIYLLWCTLADSMHFTLMVYVSQCSPLISGIKWKEVYFLNTGTSLSEKEIDEHIILRVVTYNMNTCKKTCTSQ